MNALFNSLIFQFSMESKRVFNQEMKHIFEMKSKRDIKGKIENSHGILKNLIEQNIVQIAEYCNPSITGEKIFSIFTTRYGQSQKLREDVFILHRILEIFEANLNDDTRRASLFESLKNYIFYFESFTFRLLRHDDYEIFVKFFAELSTDTDMNSLSSSSVKMLAEKIHNFKIFLESTLSLIDNRAELKDNPIDREKAEQLLRQYIH